MGRNSCLLRHYC